ncbi:MAG TPA: hypothetical protein VFN87_04820 [Solirubrobacteraceae bacterium]|nr:hypothetical protein [Solirubrobacteraceae bacterium]
MRVLRDRLELADSVGGHDRGELGVHVGVPSIAFNVIFRID